MHRRRLSFILVFLIGSMLFVAPVGAADDGCTLRANFSIGDQHFSIGDEIDDSQEDGSLICMIGSLYHALNWFFYILIMAVGIMILYGAFLIITSSGNPDRVGQGKRVIIFAIIGLVVGLMVRVIPSIVIYLSGMG
ncbi:MAG TPA: hypothetical protein PKX21_01570 [Candidatus Pacearchaeota archaeon]|nr:hypothetical protein [Candidatus Pacearchaeota archaeon]